MHINSRSNLKTSLTYKTLERLDSRDAFLLVFVKASLSCIFKQHIASTVDFCAGLKCATALKKKKKKRKPLEPECYLNEAY